MLFLILAALALAYHATFTIGTPTLNDIPSSLLAPRGAPKCDNNPSITAGSLTPANLNSRALLPLDSGLSPHLYWRSTPAIPPPLNHQPGTRTRVWCSPSSRTYIILRVTHALAGPAIDALLQQAINTIHYRLIVEGDGVISGGGLFGLNGENGLVLQTWNSNNHQTTWAVLKAALGALKYYMGVFGYGEVGFAIFDGDNQVGEGSLGEVGGGGN